MAEGGEDWELCKENIQPLKQGRAMSSLQAALQGKDTVQQRRRNFEEELRTYSGEDPLDVWHRYILWLEQHFPRGGHEVNLQELLEKCISLFVTESKYTDDPRFVDVWLRYADISSEPEVVFKAMYDRGVGAGLAPFYVRWANHREAVGDSKNAAKILRKGITRKAYPKETLEAQLRHLEARVSRQVAQQMMEVGEEAATTEDNRSVLATLKQVGRRGQVGTERALQRVEVQGGVGGKALGHAGNRAPRVLSRENPEGDDDVFVRPAAPAPFVVAAEGAKENASRPGKWTSAKVRQVTNNVAAGFTIPQDEAPNDPVPGPPDWVPGSSKALSVQRGREERHVPASGFILVQNPKERPMYNKLKVYGGTRELQFEEIRWAKMLAKEKEQERLEREAAKDREVQALRSQVEQMRNELAEMRRLFVQNRSAPVQEQQVMKEQINLLEQSILITNRSLRVSALPPALQPSVHGAAAVPVQNGSQSSSPGNTTTTDVSCMVRGLWNGTLAQSGLEEKSPAANCSTEGRVAQPTTAAAPFEVFSEPTQTRPPSVPCGPADPTDVAGTCLVADENGPPPGSGQQCARSVSRPHQRRIPFAELEPPKPPAEDEEEEEEGGGMNGFQPFTDDDNFTYAPTKSFVKKVTSTPFDGRLPPVGEDFTVGGLTELVQDVALEPEARKEPYMAAAVKRRLSAPLVVAGDLSTILEGSKESSSKSGSSSGSSCSSGSSSVSAAALSAQSRLPALQEEASPPRQQLSPEDCGQGDHLDPFDRIVTDTILSSLAVGLEQRQGFSTRNSNRPLLKPDHTVTLGWPRREFHVQRLIATGAYAKVYLAEVVDPEFTFMDTDGTFEHPEQRKVALKVLADCNPWEFFICSELRSRLAEKPPPTVLDSVVTIEAACLYRNGAILVMPFGQYGTLLDLVRRYQEQQSQGSRGIPESMALYFALELLLIVSAVHKCGIIHGDLKPDNVLVSDLPTERNCVERLAERTHCLQLIDFGRGIDQHQFQPGTVFTEVVQTNCFKCTEMMDGRPWTFQTDWYGVVACIHIMLFGEYMEVAKGANGVWAARQRFKRYWQRDLWESLFSTLLNIPSCAEPPDVTPFVARIAELLGNPSRAQDLLLHAHKASGMS
ncbi:uncharacterized protein ISCGN_028805 [Ixodes scapularis]